MSAELTAYCGLVCMECPAYIAKRTGDDALETNDSAVAIMGDEVLSQLARDLADTVRRSAKIDWTMKESIRAEMRVLVKRTLRKYGYPPDKQQKATDTVIQQAELLGEEWAG